MDKTDQPLLKELSPEQVHTLAVGLPGEAPENLESLVQLLYGSLRGLARRHLARERADITLQPTELVHEAFMKLEAQFPVTPESQGQFMALASRVMRQVLVDHARSRLRQKRGEGVRLETFTDSGFSAEQANVDNILEVDRLLSELEQHNPDQCRILECRFFAGMSIAETADALGLSASSVTRGWRFARAWLLAELNVIPARI